MKNIGKQNVDLECQTLSCRGKIILDTNNNLVVNDLTVNGTLNGITGGGGGGSNGPSGSLDLSFGIDGQYEPVKDMYTSSFYTYPPYRGQYAYTQTEGFACTTQTDGRIVVVGYSDNKGAIWRLNANGTTDCTFGRRGLIKLWAPDFLLPTPINWNSDTTLFQAVEIQNDDKIVVCGETKTGSTYYGVVLRLNTDGTFDTTFNGSGFQLTPNYAKFYGLAINETTQSIVACGSDFNNYGLIYQYKMSDGSLDTVGFNAPNGFVLTPGSYNYVTIKIQTTNHILVTSGGAGGIYQRYTQNGALIASFEPYLYSYGSYPLNNNWTIQANDMIVAIIQYYELPSVGVYRVKADLSGFDYDFNDGETTIDVGSNGVVANSVSTLDLTDLSSLYQGAGLFMVITQTGPVLFHYSIISDPFGSTPTLICRNYDAGNIISTGDRVVSLCTTPINYWNLDTPGYMVGIDCQSDDKIVIGGYVNLLMNSGINYSWNNYLVRPYMARFQSDGKIDLSFGQSGHVTIQTDMTRRFFANALHIQSNGKVLATGISDQNGYYNMFINRIN